MWRSLVAHLTGGQGVAGSNPVIPTFVLSQGIGVAGPACLRVRQFHVGREHFADYDPLLRRAQAPGWGRGSSRPTAHLS